MAYLSLTALLTVSLITLAGCANDNAASDFARAASSPPPDGAIQIEDYVWVQPGGLDEVGCQRYRAWSAVYEVSDAEYWRTVRGVYTLHRGHADCPPLPAD